MFLLSPGRGRPDNLTSELDELLVITYCAIESTNVERWALEAGAEKPPELRGGLRRAAYETDVVGNIHRIGQRYWLSRGESAVWERPFPTGKQGRPPAVDISLFNKTLGRETRLEFGLYSVSNGGGLTRTKLETDASGLYDLSTQLEPKYGEAVNYVVLWHETRSNRTTAAMTDTSRRSARNKFGDHARKISDDRQGYQVNFLRAVAGPLFTPRREHHWTIVGLFEVTAPDTSP